MHFNISQEPLYTETYRENAAAPEARDQTLREPAPSKFISTLHKKHFMQEFTGKMPQDQDRRATHTLRERAQSKCTSTCAQEPLHFICENLQVKCRGLAGAGAPRPGTTLCASLRGRNACQHFTRATVIQKFTGKMLADQSGAPWSSTGLYTYRKNPSVWTHCLGKKITIHTSLYSHENPLLLVIPCYISIIWYARWFPSIHTMSTTPLLFRIPTYYMLVSS